MFNDIKFYFRRNPLALTFASMLVSIICYRMIFSWVVALGFTVSLLIHEMGHFYAAKRQKIDVTVPVFIPYLGALINFKENPYNAEQEAYIGIAGPIAGTLAAFASYGLFLLTGYTPFLTIAILGSFLNLFNLIPLSPMDGGRTVTVITPWLWLLGAAMLIGAMFWFKSIVILLIGFFGFQEIRTVLFDSAYKTGSLSAYYKSSWKTKVLYSSIYLGLIGLLVCLLMICASNPVISNTVAQYLPR